MTFIGSCLRSGLFSIGKNRAGETFIVSPRRERTYKRRLRSLLPLLTFNIYFYIFYSTRASHIDCLAGSTLGAVGGERKSARIRRRTCAITIRLERIGIKFYEDLLFVKT